MIIAMADESGIVSGNSYFSMAAYVADHREWVGFNAMWADALSRHGLSHFHAWEFAGFRGPFAGWTEARRRALMKDLLEAIVSFELIAVGAALKLSSFDRLDAASQEGLIGPWMCCFQELVYGIGLHRHSDVPGGKIDFVYSRQDQFAPKMKGLWDFSKDYREYGRSLGVLEFQDMRIVPGLQSADLLAYEFRHFYHLKETRPDLGRRFPFRVILAHQESHGAKTLKYLPGWLLEFQAKGISEEAMSVIYSDVEKWEHMFQELNPAFSDMLKDVALIKVLDRYRFWRPDGLGEPSLLPR